MKKFVLAFCLVALVFSLSSCFGAERIKEEDAKPFVEEYLTNLEEGNYEILESTSYFYEDDVVRGFEELERETNLDFQAGIEIVEYTKFTSRHSDSYYGTPICSFIMQVKIGGKNALMEVQVLYENDAYKTCDIYITINDELFGID